MLNEQQQKAFNYLFDVFDENGNGSLSQDDFHKAFEAIKAGSSADKAARIEKAAQRLYLSVIVFGDDNKDKQMSREEWLKWAEGFAADVEDGDFSRKYEHFVDAIFASITRDDENITSQEYALWFHCMGLEGDAVEYFQQMDANGDGSISKDEFNELMLAFVQGNTSKKGHQFFGRLQTLGQFVEEKINHYASMITTHKDKADDIALGQLTLYMALRRIQKGNRTLQDLGMMDAVNDVLQFRGLTESGRVFYK